MKSTDLKMSIQAVIDKLAEIRQADVKFTHEDGAFCLEVNLAGYIARIKEDRGRFLCTGIIPGFEMLFIGPGVYNFELRPYSS